jgi:adenylate cyclase class 2
MFEVEMKFKVDDPTAFLQRLSELKISLETEVEESDTFYRHPSRDFTTTDECLRMRVRKNQQGRKEQSVTYKGPKIDTVTKTRREIEIEIEPDTPWHELLEALGFTKSSEVQKFRRSGAYKFEGCPFEILLDRLPSLNNKLFIELETIADNDSLEEARKHLLNFAKFLGLKEDNNEIKSYLALTLGGLS